MASDNEKLWDYHQTTGRSVLRNACHRLMKVFRIVRKAVPHGSILDIGFGDGSLLESLHDAGYDAAGLDLSAQNIAYTGQEFAARGKRIELRQGDITALPFRDGTFDCVIASEVLEHLDEDASVTAVKEVARCLKPGGVFVLTVPAHEKLEENNCYCPRCGHSFHRWGHQQSFGVTKIKTLLTPHFNGSVTISAEEFRAPGLSFAGNVFYLLRKAKILLGRTTAESHLVAIAVK